MDRFVESFPDDCAYFGIALPPKTIIDKCAEVAQRYNLDSEEFFEQWISFSMFNSSNKDGTTPTEQSLELFERHLVEQSEKQSKKKTKESTKAKQTNINELAVESIGNPSSEKKRSRDVSPDSHDAKRTKEDQKSSVNESQTEREDLMLSQHLSTSAQIDDELEALYENFSERKEPLKILESFHTNDEIKSKTTFKHSGVEETLVINQMLGSEKLVSEDNLFFDVKLMKRKAVSTKIDNIAKYLLQKFSLDNAIPFSLLPYRPDEGIVYGQVCKNNSGKMDKLSITLETSLPECLGATTNVDLNSLQMNASLFPGQIVAISGHKGRQNTVNATRIYTDATLDLPTDLPQLNMSGPLQVVIASGPFTMKNNLSYEPLIALMAYVHEHRPHVLILIGPFLDSDHEHQANQSYELEFQQLIDGLMKNLLQDQCNTKVVIVSSSKDLHHYNVYPTPPYEMENKYQNLYMMPDPSVIDINGLKIGATSTDIIFHLNKEELPISKNGQMLTNRMSRIVEHIISQQSFYPLYPPNKEICLDTRLFMKHGYLKETPHIMLLPSSLRYFVKDIKGCLVVNPERLVKGCSSGTFSRLEVDPHITSTSIVNNVVCEILKI